MRNSHRHKNATFLKLFPTRPKTLPEREGEPLAVGEFAPGAGSVSGAKVFVFRTRWIRVGRRGAGLDRRGEMDAPFCLMFRNRFARFRAFAPSPASRS